MTDHKFTDDEVIKALECCLNGNVNESRVEVCSPCPFFRDGNCTDLLKQNALVLINRQKAEIDKLQAIHADMTESLRLASEANKDMQAEIERLNKEVDRLSQCVLYHDGIVSDLEKDVLNAKSEAIKEFAENVKAIFECVLYFDDDVKECILNEIDDIEKEMTEGEK